MDAFKFVQRKQFLMRKKLGEQFHNISSIQINWEILISSYSNQSQQSMSEAVSYKFIINKFTQKSSSEKHRTPSTSSTTIAYYPKNTLAQRNMVSASIIKNVFFSFGMMSFTSYSICNLSRNPAKHSGVIICCSYACPLIRSINLWYPALMSSNRRFSTLMSCLKFLHKNILGPKTLMMSYSMLDLVLISIYFNSSHGSSVY